MTIDAREARYVFDNSWLAGRERLAAAEQLLDPGTFRNLEILGVGEGWQCLEAGAGGGSVARWLCERVGGSGRVTATDIDTRFLSAAGTQNLEVIEQDLCRDELREGAYDLVHTRLVLEHLPQRDAVLTKLGKALRPGGWLLIEAVDYVSGVPITRLGARLHRRTLAARLRMMRDAGLDPEYGRTLPGAFRARGLTQVGAEGRVWIMEGGSAGAQWFRLSMAQIRDRLVRERGLEDAEVGQMLEMFENPDFAAWTPVIVAAWGRAGETRPQ